MLPSLLFCFAYYGMCDADEKCICGVDITETFQIINKDEKQLYNIGSVCINIYEYLKK